MKRRKVLGLLAAAPAIIGSAAAQTDDTGLESNQCAVFMSWMTTVHSPAMGSP